MLGDLDTFFVAVERIHRPELQGVPVVIGGKPDQRGVVAACSYEARKLGIRSAMNMGAAYQLAHKANSFTRVAWLHDGLHGQYSLYSKRVQDILRDSVPVFEARSIDEFQLDVSGCEKLFTKLYGGIVEFAEHLRRRVRNEVGLPLSFGIGPNRIVAKMASRYGKPDGVHMVEPNQVPAFLAPQTVQSVPGIGPVTTERLKQMGVVQVAQLLALPRTTLRGVLGNGLVRIVDALTGQSEDYEQDESAFTAKPQPKSIGHETTFERDLQDPELLEETLWTLTEDACRRLREKGLLAKHVTIRLRYSDFATHTHGGFFESPTDLDHEVYERARQLFWQAHRRLRVRLVGVRLERLVAGGNQPGLFDPLARIRGENLVRTVDKIRSRFGRNAVLVGPGVRQLSHASPEADAVAGIPSAFLPEGRK